MTTSTTDDADVLPMPTPGSTRDLFARLSGRGYTVLRNSLVQRKTKGKWHGSSLGRLVEARQPRALLAYLLLVMNWTWIDRRDSPLEADVWSRALSPTPPRHPWPGSAMTRIWNALEDQGLTTRARSGHLIRVEPRREDARGPYLRPRPDQDKAAREKFFTLPDAFWSDGWHERLRLPGTAVLLILLSETQGRDSVSLPLERARDWYGISPKTLQTGLDELRKHGLLGERREWVVNELSKIGRSPKFYYWPLEKFSRAARLQLTSEAVRETKKRAADAEGVTPKKKRKKGLPK